MNQVTLSTLAGGAVAERFEDALEQVIANIQDVNTEPKTKRTIALTITIAPNSDRDFGMVGIEVKTKLAPAKGVSTAFHMGMQQGRAMVSENNPKQPGLLGSGEPKKPNLVEIKKHAND